MLDRRKIAQNPDLYKKMLSRRGEHAKDALTVLLQLEERWKDLKQEGDELRHRQKRMGPEMGRMDKKSAEFNELRQELGKVSARVKAIESEVRDLEDKRKDILLRLPNVPHTSTPDGAGEEDNREIARWGEPRTFDFEPKPHWEIGEALGILDFETAVRMSGSRFAVLRSAGAMLERALIQFMLDVHTREHGYTEVWPPFLVKRHAMEGTGQLPNLEEDCYKTEGDDPYYLIPTAEVPLVNLHREEILDMERLPLNYVAFTPCFRSEAGSHGQDVRGLIRQHQFSKVELVKFTDAESSYEELERLREHAEKILRLLELPYRTIELCSGDLGFASAKTYDLEVWLPGQNRYREISSCSNCEDFQARRSMIRYRVDAGDNRLCHTLNGSGLAVGRTLIAILENNQQADGSVLIPTSLHSYTGGCKVIEPVKNR